MEEVKSIFESKGVDLHCMGNELEGKYVCDSKSVSIYVVLQEEKISLRFSHGPSEFTVEKPYDCDISELISLCLTVLPCVLFGHVQVPQESHAAATSSYEQEQMPSNIYQTIQPPRVVQEYPHLPQIGEDDLNAGAPFNPIGNQMGRNHPFFNEPRIEKDEIRPNTDRPDGFRTELDKKYMFL